MCVARAWPWVRRSLLEKTSQNPTPTIPNPPEPRDCRKCVRAHIAVQGVVRGEGFVPGRRMGARLLKDGLAHKAELAGAFMKLFCRHGWLAKYNPGIFYASTSLVPCEKTGSRSVG